MPGICGIISKMPKGKSKKNLGLMVDCMMHETFYNSGTYINNELGIYTGWTCHKDSFSDCMPVMNEKKDMVLIYSGENFADKEVTTQLKRKNHRINRYNASYLIHLYEEMEDEFLKELNGWFAGVLVDIRRGKILLFNDRFGMQRLYYYESKGAFYFSSEAKSLLKVCPELRSIDMRGLGEFFSCNCVLENRTLFKNVFLLPGGSAWTFCDAKSVKKGRYFRQDDWENQPWFEKEFFYDKLQETIIKILPRYFRSEQQIGMSLTGGLDSRMILSNIDIPPGKLPFYTFGGMYRDCFDVKVARKIADSCQQSHTVLRLGKEFLADFPNSAEKAIYITDGSRDICGSYNMYLNGLARKIAPIRITGTFGGEILRGVTMFKVASPDENLFHPDFKKFLLEAVNTVKDTKKGCKLSLLLFKEAPWLKNCNILLEQSQLTYRAPFMDKDFLSLMYRTPADVLTTKEISLRLIKDGNPSLYNIMSDRGYGGQNNFLFSKSVQLFYTFLFKAEWYYNTGMSHSMAKLDHTLAPLHLGKLILGRNKFDHYRIWFQNELSDYVREILLDKLTASRPFWNEQFLEEMVKGHIRGDRNYLNEIIKALTVELVYRIFID